jgi:hypothetical protein
MKLRKPKLRNHTYFHVIQKSHNVNQSLSKSMTSLMPDQNAEFKIFQLMRARGDI